MLRALHRLPVNAVGIRTDPIEPRDHTARIGNRPPRLGIDGDIEYVLAVEGVDLKSPDQVEPAANRQPHQFRFDSGQ